MQGQIGDDEQLLGFLGGLLNFKAGHHEARVVCARAILSDFSGDLFGGQNIIFDVIDVDQRNGWLDIRYVEDSILHDSLSNNLQVLQGDFYSLSWLIYPVKSYRKQRPLIGVRRLGLADDNAVREIRAGVVPWQNLLTLLDGGCHQLEVRSILLLKIGGIELDLLVDEDNQEIVLGVEVLTDDTG